MSVAVPVKKRSYTAYGGSAAFFRNRARRTLWEGPANTGKTRAATQWVDLLCNNYPGIRVLLCRQTLQSLRESIQVTLEEKVWVPGHPAMTYGTKAKRSQRRLYQYPPAPDCYPSTIVLGGLEDPGWTYSMEYDVIVIFEAWEVAMDSIERLYRANRNHVLCRYNLDADLQPKHAVITGLTTNAELAAACSHDWEDERWLKHHKCWQQIICDTNPADEFHHLNQMAAPLSVGEIGRIKEGQLPSSRVFSHEDYPFVRILSRHEDNPACTDEDLENLRELTGHRRARLYLGLWTSAEGLIWTEFDPTRHCVTANVKREGVVVPGDDIDRRSVYLEVLRDDGTKARVDIRWTFGSFDFGYRAPACLTIWGVDAEERLWMLYEVYRAEERDDWWAARIEEFYLELGLKRVVCDSEDPGRIVMLNARLGPYLKRNAPPICVPVKKSVPKKGGFKSFKPAAISLVGDGFKVDRIFFRRDSLRHGRDKALSELRKPVCTVEEIVSYVYPEGVDGKPLKETPDEGCADHGCDTVQYACTFAWRKDLGDVPKDEGHPIGSAGWRLGHDRVRMMEEVR